MSDIFLLPLLSLSLSLLSCFPFLSFFLLKWSYLDGVPSQTNDSLDKNFARTVSCFLKLFHRMENHDVSGNRVSIDSVRDFLADEPVTDAEGRVHG